jgi:hypothetical protein
MVTIQFFVCAQDIKYILSTMPTEDKEALTRLFYWMMRNDNLSYTLFGNKPISLSGDFDVNSSENLKIEGRCSRRFWNYWQIWEKYEKNFQIQNYLLIKEKSITVSNVTNVVFINKKAFINIFNKHAKIFNKILNKHLTSDSLLKEIEDNRKFAPIIKNNEILWGILLGYGVHNAKLYDKKYKLERFIYFDELPKIPLKKPSPSKSFSSIEEELDFIELKTEPFGEYGYSPIIQNAVHFMVNPEHPETKALEKKYQKLRSKISAIYAQGDFLEITLSKLTSKE